MSFSSLVFKVLDHCFIAAKPHRISFELNHKVATSAGADCLIR